MKMTDKAACLHGGVTMQGILDLPTELLCQILSLSNGVAPADIYNLAVTSRRLMAVGLPLYLETQGIRNPEYETSVYVLRWARENSLSAPFPDMLSALNLSSIKRVRHLRCFFQDPKSKSERNSLQDVHNLPIAIDRLSRFVRRLQRVETAEIYLVWDQYFINRAKNIAANSLVDLKEWARALGKMLNLLIERGCTSLTLQYDSAVLLPAFRFLNSNSFLKALSPFSSKDKELRWEFTKLRGPDKSLQLDIGLAAQFAPSAALMRCLTSLSIHSNALLLPPFISWTIEVIRTQQTLTSLSFACISSDSEVWAAVLPAISDAVSARLTELKFFHYCPHLRVDDLLKFIYSSPNLEHLSIDRTFRERFSRYRIAGISVSKYRIPKLLRLMKLTGPIDMVGVMVLQCINVLLKPIPPPFPNLQSITIYPADMLMHPPSYIKAILHGNQLLKFITRQPFSSTPLLSMDVQMEYTDFLPVYRYMQNIDQEGEFRRALWDTLSEDAILKLTRDGRRPHLTFDHITHLILYSVHGDNPYFIAQTLCLWLTTLFPSVERLTFTLRREAHPRTDVEMGDDLIQCLIKDLHRLCPAVRSLVVGDVEYLIR